MAGFELVHPGSLDAVCEEISSGDEGIKLVAGGVALSILIKQRLFRPVPLVGMKTVPGLDKINLQDKVMKIGASVLHRTIETSTDRALEDGVGEAHRAWPRCRRWH